MSQQRSLQTQFIHPYDAMVQMAQGLPQRREQRLWLCGIITVSLAATAWFLWSPSSSVIMNIIPLGAGSILLMVITWLSFRVLEHFGWGAYGQQLTDAYAQFLQDSRFDQVSLEMILKKAERRVSGAQLKSVLPIVLVSVLVGLISVLPVLPGIVVIVLIIASIIGSFQLLNSLERALIADIIIEVVENTQLQQHRAKNEDDQLLLAELLCPEIEYTLAHSGSVPQTQEYR